MARSCGLSPIITRKIIAARRRGLGQEAVADRAGISDRTLRSWLAKGQAGEEPFASLHAAYTAAFATFTAAEDRALIAAARAELAVA